LYRGHDQAPDDPKDGTVFICSCCGYTATYIVPDGETDGVWVD
jgi:rubrerythrin